MWGSPPWERVINIPQGVFKHELALLSRQPVRRGMSAFGAAEQVQRSDFGTLASACSMCSPQPAQVGLLQFGQVIRRHMGSPSALHVESDFAVRGIAGDLSLTCRHVQTRLRTTPTTDGMTAGATGM